MASERFSKQQKMILRFLYGLHVNLDDSYYLEGKIPWGCKPHLIFEAIEKAGAYDSGQGEYWTQQPSFSRSVVNLEKKGLIHVERRQDVHLYEVTMDHGKRKVEHITQRGAAERVCLTQKGIDVGAKIAAV